MGKAEKTRLRFSRSEIRKMEKLLQEGNTNLLDENFHQKLSDEFNHARARDKTIKVEQVHRWFFSRMNDHVREAASSPMESNELVIVLDSSPIYPKELSVVPDASLSNSAPESSSDTPKDIGQKVAEKTEWEFEARSSREGAWYDVATFLAHRMDIFGEPEVRVRFEGFGAEEDEWVNVKKAVRVRSIPLESTDCRNVAIGDLVLCFRETSDRDAYYDAHVMEIQRKQHDIRGCRCLFDIKYVHDQAEEKVHLRKLCSRPVFKSPNGLSNNKCGTSPAG